MVQALVFDFDGLILDTETSEFETVADAWATFGLELSLSDWQATVGRADHAHWADVLEAALGGPIPDRDAFVERRRDAHRARVESGTVLDGVVPLLHEASSRGIPVAVASSSSASWVEPHLERLELRGHIAAVRCRDHVERAKPWPDVYVAALEALGVGPSRAVALEDSHHGLAAARSAGLWCVAVPNQVTAGQDHGEADLVVGSLADLTWDDLADLVGASGDRGGDRRMRP